MEEIRAICAVGQDRIAREEVPLSIGPRAELIVQPATESEEIAVSDDLGDLFHGSDLDFCASSYIAVTEDDESEDAIWESYLHE